MQINLSIKRKLINLLVPSFWFPGFRFPGFRFMVTVSGMRHVVPLVGLCDSASGVYVIPLVGSMWVC